MKHYHCQKLSLILAGGDQLLATCVQAAIVTKAATGADLTAGANWGGAVPGPGDTAIWISSPLGAGLTAATAINWGAIENEFSVGRTDYANEVFPFAASVTNFKFPPARLAAVI